MPVPFSISQLARLKKEAIHNRSMAPTVEVTRLPIIPVEENPKRLKSHPPNTPPTIPINKLISRPKPPPRVILPARKPAKIPIKMYQIKLISFQI